MNESENTGTRLIPLTQGQFAIVDASDYEWLSQWRWYFWKLATRKTGYAMRAVHTPVRGTIPMHRAILTAKSGQQIDHRDGNGLNNSRHNLRFCTHAQNQQNRSVRRDNNVGIKGVYETKEGRTLKFRVRIRLNKKVFHVGYFRTAFEAGEAYRKAANKFHGEFSCA